MTKEQIEARKAELLASEQRLLAEKDQVIANLNATVGAIADCDYWLKVLAEEKPA